MRLTPWLVPALLAILSACGGSSGPAEPETLPVASIELPSAAATLARGQFFDLQVTLRDAAGQILSSRPLTWSSLDSAVIQVQPSGATGEIMAGTAGSTTVSASIDGVSGSIVITVVEFASVTAGQAFSCALSTAGKLYCAGTPYGAASVPVAPSTQFGDVTIGGLPAADLSFACAIASDQRAWCWGSNGAGQLGTGDFTSRAEPTLVSGDLSFGSISAGNTHVCGITTTQQAFCWGEGAEGRLGDGATTNRMVPTAVQAPPEVVFTQIDAGAFATCARATSGKAYCWGRNDLGQLGSSQVPFGELGHFSVLPVEVEGPAGVAVIRTKGPKSCLLDGTGRAHCSGDNSVGGLGSNTTQSCYGGKPCSPTPQPVETSQVFVALAVSQFAACGLAASGSTLCWGMDFERLFGHQANQVPACTVPGAIFPCTVTPVAGATGLATLTASRTNHCGMGLDGIAYCWGGNQFGQRGGPGQTSEPAKQVFTIAPASAP
jgi:alpha-tubulin suppressor-like RCC1 family protein